MAALTANPKEFLTAAKELLRPTSTTAPEALASLIEDLDNKSFAKRDQASAALLATGGQAEGAIRSALANNPSLEVTERLRSILAKLPMPHLLRPFVVPTQILQRLRGIHILEIIGTDDAIAVLAALAKGAPAVWETQEARLALSRLNSRVH